MQKPKFKITPEVNKIENIVFGISKQLVRTVYPVNMKWNGPLLVCGSSIHCQTQYWLHLPPQARKFWVIFWQISWHTIYPPLCFKIWRGKGGINTMKSPDGGDGSCENVQLTAIWPMVLHTAREGVIQSWMTSGIWIAMSLCGDIMVGPNVSFRCSKRLVVWVGVPVDLLAMRSSYLVD